MREILFRGKHTHTNEFIYGYYSYNKERDEHKISNGSGTSWFVKPETIGQYTGLKDMNGTKIFEGDIVRCKKMSNEYIVIVEWANVFAGYYLRFTDKPTGLCELCFVEDVEVIGNIYDNPEI